MDLSKHCSELGDPSKVAYAVNIFILVGILVSYLPQHYRIITRRSSQGISPYFVLLGTTSATCMFANVLLQPESRANRKCCNKLSFYECSAALVGVGQVGMQWVCFSCILLLYLIFFPKASPLAPPKALPLAPTYRTALFVTLTSVVHGIFTFVLSGSLVLWRPTAVTPFANFLGVFASVLSAVQYFPQLHTTFRLKAVGSLSIPMMLIQTPGAFLWAGMLASTYGIKGWSTWVVFVITGALQGILLGMGIYYELVARKKKNDKTRRDGSVDVGARHDTDDEGGHVVEGDGDEDSERSPLLGPRR
ncbi:MAG: hypothetical protein M1833_005660 [Piccolia ochrophora]|nr:MAG: hypothetical protein M1833_005660 [Piccolia ochrophora]